MTEEECTEVPSQDKSAGIDTSNNDVGAVEAVTEHSKEASNHADGAAEAKPDGADLPVYNVARGEWVAETEDPLETDNADEDATRTEAAEVAAGTGPVEAEQDAQSPESELELLQPMEFEVEQHSSASADKPDESESTSGADDDDAADLEVASSMDSEVASEGMSAVTTVASEESKETLLMSGNDSSSDVPEHPSPPTEPKETARKDLNVVVRPTSGANRRAKTPVGALQQNDQLRPPSASRRPKTPVSRNGARPTSNSRGAPRPMSNGRPTSASRNRAELQQTTQSAHQIYLQRTANTNVSQKAAAATAEEMKQRLWIFYAKYAPEKIENVDQIVQRYFTKQDDLDEKLLKLYGANTMTMRSGDTVAARKDKTAGSRQTAKVDKSGDSGFLNKMSSFFGQAFDKIDDTKSDPSGSQLLEGKKYVLQSWHEEQLAKLKRQSDGDRELLLKKINSLQMAVEKEKEESLLREAQISKMVKEQAKLSAPDPRIKQELEQVRTKLERKEADLVGKDRECQLLTKMLSKEEASSSSSSRELKQLQREVDAARKREEDLKIKVVKLEGQVQDFKSQVQKLSESSSANRSASEDLQKVGDELSSKLEKKEAELAASYAKLMSNQELAESRLCEANDEKMSALLELTRKSSELSLLQARVAEAEGQVGDHFKLREELSAATRQVATLEGMMGELRTQASEARRAEMQARAELEANSVGLKFIEAGGSVNNPEMQKRLVELETENRMLKFVIEEADEKRECEKREVERLKKQLEDERRDWEDKRRKLHNQIQELKGNVRVFARIRPMHPTEAEEGESPLVSHSENTEVNFVNPETSAVNSYSFDGVLDPMSTQQAVFTEVSTLVQSAIDGYQVCLMAYGQTGSGKTHTMVGGDRDGNRGLIPRSVEQILSTTAAQEARGWKFRLEASCLEVYKENVRDLLLLDPKDASDKKLDIKHTDDGGTIVTDLKSEEVSSAADVTMLMDRAAKIRSTARTDMNHNSSRSHSVFWLKIFGTHAEAHQEVQGALFLVDLAGSERLSKSNATGDRLSETQAINKSLSALGDVFQALNKKTAHIPFRNSKLTWLLQPCLSGHGKTMMMLNLSPARSSSHESLCSLRFGALVSSTELGKAKRQITSTVGNKEKK